MLAGYGGEEIIRMALPKGENRRIAGGERKLLRKKKTKTKSEGYEIEGRKTLYGGERSLALSP